MTENHLELDKETNKNARKDIKRWNKMTCTALHLEFTAAVAEYALDCENY